MSIESGKEYFESLRSQDKSLKEIKSELQQKTSNELNELKLDIYLSNLLKNEGLKIVKDDTLEYINIIFKKLGSSNQIKWNKEADDIEVGDIIKFDGNRLYKISGDKKTEIGNIEKKQVPSKSKSVRKENPKVKQEKKFNNEYKKIDSSFSLIEREISSTKNFIEIAKKDIKKGNDFDWFESAFKYVATLGDYNKTTKQENYENSINYSIITIYKILGKLKNEIIKLKKNGGNINKIREYEDKYNVLIGKIKKLNNGKEIPGITFSEADENSWNEGIENIKNGKSGEVLFGYGKGLLKGSWEVLKGVYHLFTSPIQTLNGIGNALGTGMFLFYGEFLGSKEEKAIAREISSKIADKVKEMGDLPPEKMGELVGVIVANTIAGSKIIGLTSKGLNIATKAGLKSLQKKVSKAYMIGYKETTALERVGNYGENVSKKSLPKPKVKKEITLNKKLEIEDKSLKKELELGERNIPKDKIDKVKNHLDNSIKSPRRNPEGLPYSKVRRPTDVMSLGDLHGDLKSFKSSLKDNSLIDESGKWIGRNTKVVKTLDIFDGGSEGLKILEEIKKLKSQGADIEVIVGSNAGKVGPIPKQNLKVLNENIDNLKVLEQVDDVLYMPGDISDNLAILIRKHGIDGINGMYRDSLKNLLKGDITEYNNMSEILKDIMKTKDHSSSKIKNPEDIASILRENGINKVKHGYSKKTNYVSKMSSWHRKVN